MDKLSSQRPQLPKEAFLKSPRTSCQGQAPIQSFVFTTMHTSLWMRLIWQTSSSSIPRNVIILQRLCSSKEKRKQRRLSRAKNPLNFLESPFVLFRCTTSLTEEGNKWIEPKVKAWKSLAADCLDRRSGLSFVCEVKEKVQQERDEKEMGRVPKTKIRCAEGLTEEDSHASVNKDHF